MTQSQPPLLKVHHLPSLDSATLVLAFSGWMDGGNVSTGTVSRLVHLRAQQIAEIDPEPFYIYNFPGSMEIAAMFRPPVEIEAGIIRSVKMPNNTFHADQASRLVLFVGKEPNLCWRTFGECVFWLARKVGVTRILFVGSFGGSVPHTREPRLYVSCSDPARLAEMQPFGFRPSTYKGPGSFSTYLMNQSGPEGMKMTSLVAEIPSYLQGTNPLSIEAVTHRLAKILRLPLDLASLRAASTAWELQVTAAVEDNQELAGTIRELENAYDNELLQETEGAE